MGFHYPRTGCCVTQTQQVLGNVLSAMLGGDDLHQSATSHVLPSVRTVKPTALTTVDCLDSTLWLFFFPSSSHDRHSAVSGCVGQMQLPAAALNEVLSASLWYGFTFYFSPAVFPTSSHWRKCVHSPQLRLKPSVVWSQYAQMTEIYFLHRGKKKLVITPWVSSNYTDFSFVRYVVA